MHRLVSLQHENELLKWKSERERKGRDDRK